jgi:hypothetical protein
MPSEPDETNPDTQELKRVQAERETQEHVLAHEATDEDETAQHQRRADKAAYLRDKLEERDRSEQEAQND